MSYTPCRPVSPCSPVPATLGRSSCHQQPPGGQWSLWRWDRCLCSPASRTSWSQRPCRCRKISAGEWRERETEQSSKTEQTRLILVSHWFPFVSLPYTVQETWTMCLQFLPLYKTGLKYSGYSRCHLALLTSFGGAVCAAVTGKLSHNIKFPPIHVLTQSRAQLFIMTFHPVLFFWFFFSIKEIVKTKQRRKITLEHILAMIKTT